jgi:hypothetical protein
MGREAPRALSVGGHVEVRPCTATTRPHPLASIRTIVPKNPTTRGTAIDVADLQPSVRVVDEHDRSSPVSWIHR